LVFLCQKRLLKSNVQIDPFFLLNLEILKSYIKNRSERGYRLGGGLPGRLVGRLVSRFSGWLLIKLLGRLVIRHLGRLVERLVGRHIGRLGRRLG
jgi:hypothetical protein